MTTIFFPTHWYLFRCVWWMRERGLNINFIKQYAPNIYVPRYKAELHPIADSTEKAHPDTL